MNRGRSLDRYALRAIALFAVASLTIGVMVGIAAVLVADAIARDDLVEDAKETAMQVQQVLVTSLVGRTQGDDREIFSDALLPHVQAGTLARVKVWERTDASSLLLVYSDLPELIGQQKALRSDRAEILGTTGTLVLAVPDDAAHDTEFRPGRQLIEVFTAFSSGDRQYLLESYFASSTDVKAARIREHFLPVLLGGIVLFIGAVLPLAISLARRLSRAEGERLLLMQRATTEREHERAQLRQYLHDGVVQDLAGATHALTAMDTSQSADASRLEAVAAILRDDVSTLRRLLVDMAPDGIAWASLADALTGIGDADGIRLDVVVRPFPDVDTTQTSLLFRCARELILNAESHADARVVTVIAKSDGTSATLSVADDGVGFDPVAEPSEGHIGLRIVEHAVRATGGDLAVRSSPGEGTVVVVTVPSRTRALHPRR